MGNSRDLWDYQKIKLKLGSRIEERNLRKISVYDQDPLLSLNFTRFHHKITLNIRITGQLISLLIHEYPKMYLDVRKDHALSTVTRCKEQRYQYLVVLPEYEIIFVGRFDLETKTGTSCGNFLRARVLTESYKIFILQMFSCVVGEKPFKFKHFDKNN